MSSKRYRIIFILIFMVFGSFGDQSIKHRMINDMENAQSDDKGGRALFPRIEYTNEWQPVGRGDPLKDPTWDYMPPVLDRVRYWADGSSKKNKNDVLVLGIPSKKLSAITPKDKHSYGPIKRTYYSPPYQSHFSSSHHHQQQQQPYLPQRLMPPPKHVTDSYPMSTHHYQQSQQQHYGWKTSNNVYTEPRPENSINHVRLSRPIVTPSPPPTTTKNPSSVNFLPTIPPADRSPETPSTSPTKPMSTQTTVKHNDPKTTVNGHLMPSSKIENIHKDTTKPLLQSILQTETASPFTKMPSSVYQIEYTSNIYNLEAINSMATSSSHAVAFVPTKPTLRPMSMKTTIKTSLVPSSSTTSATTTIEQEEQKKHYVLPDMQAGTWPVYNLVIEGHSKVKTYGLKNDDEIGNNMPKIRPVQAKKNPIVERITNSQEGPEFNLKHLKGNSQKNNQPKKIGDDKKSASAMTSLLSLLDNSFSDFLSDDENVYKVRHESEMIIVKNEKESSEKRKTRRSIPDDENNKQEQVFSVSFQVNAAEGNERPHIYRKGTVISEKLWPFQTADIFR